MSFDFPAFGGAGPVPIRIRVPTDVTSAVLDFCKEVEPSETPVFIQVTPSDWAKPLECYSNVAWQIRRYGGRSQYGWRIGEIPNEFIEAEFHTVWVDDTRRLVDLTPTVSGDGNRILFLPSTSKIYQCQCIPNVRKALANTPYVMNLMTLGPLIERQRLSVTPQAYDDAKPNDPCPCASGKKFKKCCQYRW